MHRRRTARRFILVRCGATARLGLFLRRGPSASLGSDARAVTITGSTFAAETGGPGPNPASTSFNIGSPTTVSDSIRSDVQYAHAQAWANATVDCSGVTKSTGGRAWSDAPGGLDSRSTLWNASASGTQVVANYTGQGTPTAVRAVQFHHPRRWHLKYAQCLSRQ